MIFKKLNSKEELDYRLFARKNYDEFHSIPGHWHPIIQDECLKMNLENSKFINDNKCFINVYCGLDNCNCYKTYYDVIANDGFIKK